MNFHPTEIPDVVLIEPKVFGDHRGFFMETWHAQKFADAGLDLTFVQDNHSSSGKGILRGLHYQLQHAQGKLVRVTRGEVYDVAVDIRRSSPTFGRHVGVTLSEENKLIMWVPPGFAHGFLVMLDDTEFQYKCTDVYAPEHERTILWNDPALGIDWPLEGAQPVLSEKDAVGTLLEDAEVYP